MNLDPQQDTPDWATEYNGTVFAPWALTADVVGLAADPTGELQSLVVQRGNEPYKGHEAWPGGFLQATDRDGVAAAGREADEEASQRDLKLLDLGIYDRFGRDPRQFAGRIDPETGRWEARGVRVASRVFLSLMRREGRLPRPAAGSDAVKAYWASVYTFLPWEDQRSVATRTSLARARRDLLTWAAASSGDASDDKRTRIERLFGEDWNEEDVSGRWELLVEARLVEEAWRDQWGRPVPGRPQVLYGSPLAFDHRQMLADALGWLRGRIKRDPNVMRMLAPEVFKLSDLQAIFEAVAGRSLYRSNFRRILAPYGFDGVDPSADAGTTVSRRPRGAQLVEPIGRKEAPSGPGKPADLFRFVRYPEGSTLPAQLTLPWILTDEST